MIYGGRIWTGYELPLNKENKVWCNKQMHEKFLTIVKNDGVLQHIPTIIKIQPSYGQPFFKLQIV